MPEEKVRWTIVVPKELDQRVREHLARTGAKKGALSAFVEDAVNRQLAADKREAL
jgi:hypothetical protein